jgi:hypothetical protein
MRLRPGKVWCFLCEASSECVHPSEEPRPNNLHNLNKIDFDKCDTKALRVNDARLFAVIAFRA